MHKDVQLQP